MGDKRKSIRVPVRLEARLEDQNGRQIPAIILNLSVDGAFVHSGVLWDAADRILLRFALPTSSMDVQSIVMWGGAIEAESPVGFGMGIQFAEMDAAQRESLVSYLRDLMKP